MTKSKKLLPNIQTVFAKHGSCHGKSNLVFEKRSFYSRQKICKQVQQKNRKMMSKVIKTNGSDVESDNVSDRHGRRTGERII